ncbi:ABC transporter substrate-binding protein [Roseovarius sp.]|uniref:ABC transporter substrate-binding protein n=1 Tax=Roseovarius sp. TaxID=1486281 RepID=UPI0035659838
MDNFIRRALGVATVGAVMTMAPAAWAEIKIGIVAPLSGPAANSGISMREAYEAAVQQANDAGGIDMNGEKQMIEVVVEDSASRPEVGVSAAQKLLTRDDVDILIGDSIASSVTLALMEVVPSFGKFAMSGQPVSIEIAKKIKSDPKKYANFWKSSFNSDAYGAVLYETVDWLTSEDKVTADDKTIAFIVEDTDYGKSNIEFTAPHFKDAGWTVVAEETVPLGHADFYPQLSKLRSDEPDVIISIFTSVNSGIALVKQMDEQGMDPLHMGVYYPIRPEFLEGVGEAANGLLWTPWMFDPANNPEHQEFADQFKSLTGLEADGDHAQGYCQMKMLLDNISRAGSVKPTALSEAFATTDYSCVIARYVYDTEIHTPKIGGEYLPVPMAQIQDGASQVVYPLSTATSEYQPVK